MVGQPCAWLRLDYACVASSNKAAHRAAPSRITTGCQLVQASGTVAETLLAFHHQSEAQPPQRPANRSDQPRCPISRLNQPVSRGLARCSASSLRSATAEGAPLRCKTGPRASLSQPEANCGGRPTVIVLPMVLTGPIAVPGVPSKGPLSLRSPKEGSQRPARARPAVRSAVEIAARHSGGTATWPLQVGRAGRRLEAWRRR
jgi:hypothetical protein